MLAISPLAAYQRDLENGFLPDTAQENAVKHTQRLYDELIQAPSNSVPTTPSLWGRLSGRFKKETQPAAVKGLYLWGGVGRGKTHLVDTFYEALPFAEKQRIHFHRFMQQVHGELKTIKDTANPLSIVADRLLKNTRILCLDEFHVNDITDAMLLSGLLNAMFQQGVSLVSTSNIPPDELYKDGLQRQRFLPAIAWIKENTEVLNVDGGVDYRLRALEQAEIYHFPLDDAATESLHSSFTSISPDEGRENAVLTINGRDLLTIREGDGIVWFDFEVICNSPRSVSDYIELAKCYNTVLIGNVPVMSETSEDAALRFVQLVDEFYDRNVKLILSADADSDALYQGKKHAFAFQRTHSRLEEMQSHDYLERPHLP